MSDIDKSELRKRLRAGNAKLNKDGTISPVRASKPFTYEYPFVPLRNRDKTELTQSVETLLELVRQGGYNDCIYEISSPDRGHDLFTNYLDVDVALERIHTLIEAEINRRERATRENVHRFYQREMEHLKKERDIFMSSINMHICPTVIKLPEGTELIPLKDK